MAVMCEECKCSIYLEEQPDGTKKYGSCENGCPCCNKEGECDKCDGKYELSDRTSRCGDCGNCNKCCTHEKEGE